MVFMEKKDLLQHEIYNIFNTLDRDTIYMKDYLRSELKPLFNFLTDIQQYSEGMFFKSGTKELIEEVRRYMEKHHLPTDNLLHQ